MGPVPFPEKPLAAAATRTGRSRKGAVLALLRPSPGARQLRNGLPLGGKSKTVPFKSVGEFMEGKKNPPGSCQKLS